MVHVSGLRRQILRKYSLNNKIRRRYGQKTAGKIFYNTKILLNVLLTLELEDKVPSMAY